MNGSRSPRAGAHGLLERERGLEVLREALASSEAGKGRLVLVAGEAGIGKTALVRQFCGAQRPEITVLSGACDALFTPRPLGPFMDVAGATGGELERLVAGGARPYEVATALMRELQKPAILVLEDVHWADEATLDVVRFLGRRVESLSALVLATYRDDQLDQAHPLRIALGELATQEAVVRLKVEPLSTAAVAKLAEPYGVDAEELHRVTAGNPFFVTEVLAGGEDAVPSTVRDAVLARTASLSASGRRLLEAAAVVPLETELWLLEALAGADLEALEECLGSGVLMPQQASVGFRHELARLTVEESLVPTRRVELHRRALRALEEPPTGGRDLARLAHHAEAAGDVHAVLRYAPAAADGAASLGAHREAAAQYARALRFAARSPVEEQAELLERRSYECYVTGQFDEGIESMERALEHRRGLGEPRKEGDALRSLSRLLRFVGRTGEAAERGREALMVLERLPDSHELAMAYSNLSHISMTTEDAEATLAWGSRAIELAERLGDVEPLVYALTNMGAVEFLAGKPEAREKLERVLELAKQSGLEEHAGRIIFDLVWWPLRQRSYSLASRYLEIGLAYSSEHGLDLWEIFLVACRARLELDHGRLAEAGESAATVLRDPRTWPVPRNFALSVLGLVRARRGDPEVWPPLDEALALAEPTGELQRIGPVAAARAEAAWLQGDGERVRDATTDALALAVQRQASWVIGELASWRRRAGIEEDIPSGAAEPYVLQMSGEWRRASELWTQMGCPYEAALALAEGDDEALLRSLEGLQGLGARPAAAIVARRLRDRGVRGIARGPGRAARENPAGLTVRETEVLRLVAEGRRNAEIAERLFLSPRTVDHHVSAIFRKLGAHTRGEAAAKGARLGLLQDR